MGAVMSVNSSKTVATEVPELPQGESWKRQRMSLCLYEGDSRLIPGLPDEISVQILARIPRIDYLQMKLVSRTWKSAFTSTELFNVRKELGTTEEWLYLLTKVEDGRLLWYALDPLSRRWQRLPMMPSLAFEEEQRKGFRTWNVVHSSIKFADKVRGWLGKKGAEKSESFQGCTVGAVDGFLYVLGGLCKASVLRGVWQYNPILNMWKEMSPMCVGRAFCKTGILNNKLYAVGGVTRGREGLTSLMSAEVFDPDTGLWSGIPSMPFLNAQALPTANLADLLKPIAIGMASYRGRLFVSQSLFSWPFFVDVGGEIYDPEMNSWYQMPPGMGDGWPVKQAGTKLSITIDDELYALEPSSSLDSATIKVYDYLNDTWKSLLGEIPFFDFNSSESSYLLAGLLGKLHVITKDASNNITIMQADVKNQLASSSSQFASGEPSQQLLKVISTRSNSSADLVSCQTLDL
ncbi:Galactose oxidase/kelch repeat superfamily protein [Euphorbia peplus]|nr:Galactose oxidase/kelch repeat superfamily protein [Euphorbia peplus]